MAEHPTLGQAVREHRVHGGDIQQALADEGPLTEDVLIDLRACRAVGIDPALAREQPVVEREIVGCGKWRHDPRLEDRVAAHHTRSGGIQARLIVGVSRDADQLAQAPWRQHGVAVQRHQVTGCARHARRVAQLHEGGHRLVGQRAHQLLQLAALALPPDPALFRGAELPLAVQQHESRAATRLHRAVRIALIQFCDRFASARQQFLVAALPRRVGIDPVAEQGKLRMRFGVGEVVQFEAMGQLQDFLAPGQHRRNHHHHAVFGRDARGQRQARQVAGTH